MAAGESGQTGVELALPRVPDQGTPGAAGDPFVSRAQADSGPATVVPASDPPPGMAAEPTQEVMGGLLALSLVACALLAFRLRSLGRDVDRLRRGRNEARKEADRLGGELSHVRAQQRTTIEKRTEALAEENRALRWRYETLKESRTRLEAQALRDELTGLLLRRPFEDVLDRELRRALRYKGPITVISWTLDESHLLSERIGPEQATRVLQRVASAVESACHRGADRVGRIGPNTFAAVLPGTALAGGARQAERVREAVRSQALPNPGSRSGGKLTVSAGLAQPDPHAGATADAVLAALEAACTEAARRGGDQTGRAQMQASPGQRAVG